MTNTNVKILNDVTKSLIDSQKGYQKCSEMSDATYFLHDQFEKRAEERQQLVRAFQNQVRAYGDTPAEKGTMTGAVHRDFTKFKSLFQDDQKAALEAIDDGEEHLAEVIETKLSTKSLDAQTRQLLKRAQTAARAGERWAEQIRH